MNYPLPPEILLEIFLYLSAQDLCRCRLVCKEFRDFIKEFKELDPFSLHLGTPIGVIGYFTIGDNLPKDGYNQFQMPTGLSIDRDSGKLFVVNHGSVAVFSQGGENIRNFVPTENFDPFDIYLSDSRILISDWDGDKIWILDKEFNQISIIRMPSGKNPAYLSYLEKRRNIIVSYLQHGILILDENGDIVQEFQLYRDNGEAFACRGYGGLCVDSLEQIIVTDTDGKQVQVYNTNGLCTRKYTCSLTFPQSICVDHNDNIIVGDIESIKIFNSDIAGGIITPSGVRSICVLKNRIFALDEKWNVLIFSNVDNYDACFALYDKIYRC